MAERWHDPGPIKERNLGWNERCPECKSPDPKGMPPMFHPAHKWGPCQVQPPGQDVCGCTVGVESSTGQG